MFKYAKSSLFKVVSLFVIFSFSITNLSFAGINDSTIFQKKALQKDTFTLAPFARILSPKSAGFEGEVGGLKKKLPYVNEGAFIDAAELVIKLWIEKERKEEEGRLGLQRAKAARARFKKLSHEAVLAEFLEMYDEALREQCTEQTTLNESRYNALKDKLKTRITEVFKSFVEEEQKKEQIAVRSSGVPGDHNIETVRTGSKKTLTRKEARAINDAIAGTLDAMEHNTTYQEVLDPTTNGDFVLLDDEIYNRLAGQYGAPLDVECHPGTYGTAKHYNRRKKTGLDRVAKRYYIRRSTFESLSPEERRVFAKHEEMHILLSLKAIKVKIPRGMSQEDYINNQHGCNVVPIVERLAYRDVLEKYLGEYKIKDDGQKLPWGYVEHVIDITNSPGIADKLSTLFKDRVQMTDQFNILYFRNMPVAIVKNSPDKKPEIKQIVGEESGENDLDKLVSLEQVLENKAAQQAKKADRTVLDVVLDDYLFFTERAKKPVHERYTATYSEMAEHQHIFEKQRDELKEKIKQQDKLLAAESKSDEIKKIKDEKDKLEKDYEKLMKTDGLALAGGKGLSLSRMDDVVDISAGHNVLTTAYFKFVREPKNKALWNSIKDDLGNLDAMDDEARDYVARKIRDLIMKSSIPKEIEKEVLIMYRHLNILNALDGKETPARVAVRSSGIKEDIKVESWLPITTGSQAGQSDTFLNVRGKKDVLEKLKEDWASLFTDRAVAYRDDAIFQVWAGKMGFKDKSPKDVYYELLGRLRHYADYEGKLEFNPIAEALTNFQSPGARNLLEAIRYILSKEKDNEQMKSCLKLLEKSADEFVHPDEIGIDVVIMQMVDSYLAGVLFTVNPATKMSGVAQALWPSWYKGDDSLVYKDEEGNITGTKPIVASFEISWGLGENVVGGKVTPDKFVTGSEDGDDWLILEKSKGDKLIKMTYRDKVMEFFTNKTKINENSVRKLAKKSGKAVSYDEVSKQISGILSTGLYGIRYLKSLENAQNESDKRKKERVKRIAKEVGELIKSDSDNKEKVIEDHLRRYFKIGGLGIKEGKFQEVLKNISETAEKAYEDSKIGKQQLTKFFNNKSERVDAFIAMLREVWDGQEDEIEKRQEVLNKFKIDERGFKDLAYLLRSFIDVSFTANMTTSKEHQNRFSITDEEALAIPRMGWAIANFYQDERDIEFAIEIDPKAPAGKRLKMYALDEVGNVLTMTKSGTLKKADKKRSELKGAGKVSFKLYSTQARPYTSGHTEVDFIQKGTEVDEQFIEDHDIEPIATGTKGENAAHTYVLVFDPSKSIAWHADKIRKLKKGEFTAEERDQVEKLGFDPGEFGDGVDDKKLSITLYLMEADPSHDPLMRLVKAVVTIRGGDTCHAAIFCREQGIPAITGVGKVMLDGNTLSTGIGLTIDANNGRIFKLGVTKDTRIPIHDVDFRYKPYGSPGRLNRKGECVDEDGFVMTMVGRVLAAASNAQKTAMALLSPKAAGNSLTRAEFKAEEIGINVFAGYGYDLIKAIQEGTKEKPELATINGLLNDKVGGSKKIVSKLNKEVFEYLNANDPDAINQFNQHVVQTPYPTVRGLDTENAIAVLTGFDLNKYFKKDTENVVDSATKGLTTAYDQFYQAISEDSRNYLEYIHGVLQRRFNFEYNIIRALEEHPWIMEEMEHKIEVEKGYDSFREYAGKEFYYFYNLMAYTIGPNQKAKNRSYDFAQDKIKGMIGSEIEGTFAWEGVNPLVGLRGTSLEIEGIDDEDDGNQKVLDFLLESVIDSDKKMHRHAWFNVFIRFVREMDALDTAMERIAKKKKKLPKQIGIMVEVPTDAMLIREISEKMIAMKKKYKKYGTELTFYSFGTNDYSYLCAKGDREDPRMKLKLVDPAALASVSEIIEKGYFYNTETGELPLVDEGSDTVLQLMEAVVKVANEFGIETSLCGEAITSLVGKGNYKAAAKIMAILQSVGVSNMRVRTMVDMLTCDVADASKELKASEKARQRKLLLDFNEYDAEIKQEEGIVKGEVIYVDKPEDLLTDELKRLNPEKRSARKDFLKLQGLESARSTMRTFGKIVVLNKNLIAMERSEFRRANMSDGVFDILSDPDHGLIKRIGKNLHIWTNLNMSESQFGKYLETNFKGFGEEQHEAVLDAWKKAKGNTAEGLTRNEIDWDDLQYAKAIILDSDISMEGWDVFSSKKGIVPARVKITMKDIAGMRDRLEGKFVTIDYAAGKMYKGNMKVKKKKVELRALPIPKHEPKVVTQAAVKEDANNAYSQIEYHPLFLLEYSKGNKGMEESLGKTFDEYMNKVIDELEKISLERHEQKKKWLLKEFEEKMEALSDVSLKTSVHSIYESVDVEKFTRENVINIDQLRSRYFRGIRNNIKVLLNGRSVEQFIKDQFKGAMENKIREASAGEFVVHTTTSLNPAKFDDMIGGFLVEQVNPNPDYGLLGAARGISDFHQINRWELEAFKEVREGMDPEDRKYFGLQVTDFKGTQAGAVAIAWKNLLKEMDIIPGVDLRVGVNISSPSDTLAIDKYIEYFNEIGDGLSFVSYDRMKLGAAWAGVDIYWKEWRRLARKEELAHVGDLAVSIVKWKVEKENAKRSEKPKMTILAFDKNDPDLLNPDLPAVASKPAISSPRLVTTPSEIDIIAKDIPADKGVDEVEDYLDDIIGAGATGVVAGRYLKNGKRASAERINKQIIEAHAKGIRTVVLAVGERGVQSANNNGFERNSKLEIIEQLKSGLNGLTPEQIANTTIVYAPLWAKQENLLSDYTQYVENATSIIREAISNSTDSGVAERVKILYGAYIKNVEKAKQYLAQGNVDGLVINQNSINLEELVSVVKYAQQAPDKARKISIFCDIEKFSQTDYDNLRQKLLEDDEIDMEKIQIGILPTSLKMDRLAENLAEVESVEPNTTIENVKETFPVMEPAGQETLGVSEVKVEAGFEDDALTGGHNVVDVVRINQGTVELGGEIFSVIGDRSYTITVTGKARITQNGEYLETNGGGILELKNEDQIVVTKEGFTTPDGKKYLFGKGAHKVEYQLEKIGDEQTVLRVDYDKTREEQNNYIAYKMIKKYIDQGGQKKIGYIVSESILGNVSQEKLQRALNKFLGDDIFKVIRYHSDSEDGIQESVADTIDHFMSSSRVPILAATVTDINKASEKKNPEIEEAIRNARVAALPDPEKTNLEEGKWFPMELIAIALLQAGLTSEAIKEAEENESVDSIATDLRNLMVQLTGKPVAISSLYYMLSLNDEGIPAQIKPKDSFAWMLTLIKRLLIDLPAKAYNPSEAFMKRLKFMWAA